MGIRSGRWAPMGPQKEGKRMDRKWGGNDDATSKIMGFFTFSCYGRAEKSLGRCSDITGSYPTRPITRIRAGRIYYRIVSHPSYYTDYSRPHLLPDHIPPVLLHGLELAAFITGSYPTPPVTRIRAGRRYYRIKSHPSYYTD
ncbi:hypothetical protein NDU88_000193 [Pleurodeles waltl]|uniref:Uncharacterized protein n=1 Tax=Pleurodeles waltl TaxID=8319 RepID=A0AAV7U4P2_PLEWA|nr:hypothetical protein NDU88_000193 [Pleurodeles waltl]